MRDRKLVTLMLVSVCVLVFLSACETGNDVQTRSTEIPPVTRSGSVSAEGRIVPGDSSLLIFSVSAPVEQVLVDEGARVSSGTVLVRLGNREQALASVSGARLEQLAAQQAVDRLDRLADLARSQAELQLASAERALILAQKAFDDLDSDEFREELDEKEIAVQDAQDEVDDAQEELDKYKDLDEDNSRRVNAEQRLEDAREELQKAVYERDIFANDFDLAQSALQQAEDNAAEARRAYEARLSGPDEEEWALAQARLENAGRQLAAAEAILRNFDLIAPYDGQVMEIKDLQVGEWVNPAQPAIVFANISPWYVETKDLDEQDVVALEIGQSARIEPDALKDVVLTGTVEWIGQTFVEKSGDVLYTVRIRLEDADERLRWGMTVQIFFE